MKRISEFRQLSIDHHHGLVLARRARKAETGTKGISASRVWEEVEKKFQYDLEPHFKIEEKYLVPPLEAIGEIDLIKRLQIDHKRLRRIINDKSVRTFAALKQFGEILERHIRFEERELFETAQKRLSSHDLELLEQACLKHSEPK